MGGMGGRRERRWEWEVSESLGYKEGRKREEEEGRRGEREVSSRR